MIILLGSETTEGRHKAHNMRSGTIRLKTGHHQNKDTLRDMLAEVEKSARRAKWHNLRGAGTTKWTF